MLVCYIDQSKGGFPFSAKCRAFKNDDSLPSFHAPIDFYLLRSLFRTTNQIA